MEAMLTIAPPLSAASRRRAASRDQKNTASRLVPMTRRQSSSLSSTARPDATTPALLTSTVTVPNACSAASKARVMALRSSTSAGIATARPPAFSILSFTAGSRSGRRATSATAAPASASTSAKRTPRPLDAPVTSATSPVRSNKFSALMALSTPRRPRRIMPFRLVIMPQQAAASSTYGRTRPRSPPSPRP